MLPFEQLLITAALFKVQVQLVGHSIWHGCPHISGTHVLLACP